MGPLRTCRDYIRALTPTQKVVLFCLRSQETAMFLEELASAADMKAETTKRYLLLLRRMGLVASSRIYGFTRYYATSGPEDGQ
jgi:DNA-binding MarR family transcriptional regulator